MRNKEEFDVPKFLFLIEVKIQIEGGLYARDEAEAKRIIYKMYEEGRIKEIQYGTTESFLMGASCSGALYDCPPSEED